MGEVHDLRRQLDEAKGRIAFLERLADEDALMPIANRRAFVRELSRTMAFAQRYGAPASVVYFDLDGLKMINDTFGHRAGDEALIQVAAMLSKGVRHSDVVARIGGDEFGILLESSDEPAAQETAARLIDQISACELLHDGEPLPLSIAVGVGMIDALDTAQAVMDRADEAMYARKAAA
jgi:diguanylate cyclase (GGDEF)-like protein